MFGRRSLLERGWELFSTWEILKSPSCDQSCGRSWKMFPKEVSDLLQISFNHPAWLLCTLMVCLWLKRLIHKKAPGQLAVCRTDGPDSAEVWAASPSKQRHARHLENEPQEVKLWSCSTCPKISVPKPDSGFPKSWPWIFSVFVNLRNTNKFLRLEYSTLLVLKMAKGLNPDALF